MPAIAENEERSASGIFAKTSTHHPVKPLNPLRMSHGSTSTKILRLPLKLNISSSKVPINSAASRLSALLI